MRDRGRNERYRLGRWLGAAMVCGLLAPRSAEAVTGGHNMSNWTPQGQVCVVCHTPHKAVQSGLLWNHQLSNNNFSWSDWTQTTGGTTLPTNIKTWSGSTKLCLSCHDGTVALGATYNPQTSYNNSTMAQAYPNAVIGLGGELKGNHPVAVPYPYNNTKNTYNGNTTGDLAMQSGWVATPTKVKVYIDPNAAAPNNRGIECASCHDPHGTGIYDYLRDSTVGSALCLNCHVK